MTPALLLIDIQRGFDLPEFWDGPRNNPDMEANAAALLGAWRAAGAPLVIIQHVSNSAASVFAPASPGVALKAGFEPQDFEKHIVKHENSAFIGTDLDVWLRRQGVTDLVICGATTQHCVSTTTRMAENLGFGVALVKDACFAMPHAGLDAQTIHDVECAILSGEFARITTTEAAIADLQS